MRLWFCPWISPENMWEIDLGTLVLFLARKHEVGSPVTPSASFVPILLAINASLKSSSLEEVIAAHNKHCQEQASVNLSIIQLHL